MDNIEFIESTPLQRLANEALIHFHQRSNCCDDGSVVWHTNKTAPKWVKDLIKSVHPKYSLPTNEIYACIVQDLTALATEDIEKLPSDGPDDFIQVTKFLKELLVIEEQEINENV